MKTKKILSAVLLMFLIVTLLTGNCLATDAEGDEVVQQDEDVSTNSEETTGTSENVTSNNETDVKNENKQEAESEWIEDDIYTIEPEGNIIIEKNVSGNLYLMGKNVTIKSKSIYGNVYVLAEEFNIEDSSEITGSIYVCAQKVNMKVITSDIYAIVGGEFTLPENHGVMRDFRVKAKKATINGVVTRNAYIEAEELTFGENALVFGKLEYTAPTEVTIPEALKENCSGEIKYTKLKTDEISPEDAGSYALDLVTNLVFVFVIFGICNLLKLKAVKPYENKNIIIQMLKELGIGLVTFALLTVLIILAIITVVGIPVAGLITIILILSFILYFAVVAVSIANVISKKLNKVISVILSTAILWMLINLPVAGFVFELLIYFIGLGILSSHIISISKNNNKKDVEAKEKENPQEEKVEKLEEEKDEKAENENDSNENQDKE